MNVKTIKAIEDALAILDLTQTDDFAAYSIGHLCGEIDKLKQKVADLEQSRPDGSFGM